MPEAIDLQRYLTEGVDQIVRDALRATVRNPRESLFMARFAGAVKKASARRAQNEAEGLHVPSYLIASIPSSCNLHCAGCYSRSNHATEDCAPQRQLTSAQWADIFRQAEELGVSFILLAGGEPLLRYDVIAAAGERPNLLFPLFTNGTFLGEKYFQLLDRCRNLIPVISIEGGKEMTDARRGEGIYDQVTANMDEFRKRGLIFGASVTVTTENLREVTSPDFLNRLKEKGCKLVIFIEFVPVTEEAQHLAPGDPERQYLAETLENIRSASDEMVLLAFPGDELALGGCMAAGREFFHINSHGGAEPCPFSPYSDVNVKEMSLKGAIASPLFAALQEGGLLGGEHKGGCVLYERRHEVEALLSSGK